MEGSAQRSGGGGQKGLQIPVHFTYRDQFLSGPSLDIVPNPDIAKKLSGITIDDSKEPKLDKSILNKTELRSNVHKFSAITPEMQDAIAKAFEGDKLDKVSGDIKRQDLYRLTGVQQANDILIDEYFKLIENRSLDSHRKLPLLYSYNTFAYAKMGTDAGNAQISNQFKKEFNVTDYSLLVVPINHKNHWLFVCGDLAKKSLQLYDSAAHYLCLDHPVMLANVKSYLKFELKKRNVDLIDNEWSESVKIVPQQENRVDCGYFSMKILDYVSRCVKPDFEQKDMLFFKKEMIYELLSKTLVN